MFDGCISLKELNLDNFNTSNVTNMSHMFCGCLSLETQTIKAYCDKYMDRENCKDILNKIKIE